jgi:redox-sensitive bicupin YhaK (pirin superfamily)
MTSPRPADQVVTSTPVLEGAGVRLRRSFPSFFADNLDPFLLFDDFSSPDPADFAKGFPWHPHRGIETVTYVLDGGVAHRDSLGNEGRIGAGDVQWMTAGSGIMHEEMPDPSGPLVGFQLWVNLPARKKMTRPHYRDVTAAMIPEAQPRAGASVRVIAGETAGARGPVSELAVAITYLDVSLEPGVEIAHAVPAGQRVFAYVVAGGGDCGLGADDGGAGGGGAGGATKPATAAQLVTFGDGGDIGLRAGPDGFRYLLLAGPPLREPIARYGPFVMNTAAEIEEARRDLAEGTFIRVEPVSTPPEVRGE